MTERILLMDGQFTDLINFSQLEMLGFKQEYVDFLAIFFILAGLCLIMKPLMALITNKNDMFALAYAISSLFVITFAAAYSNSDYLRFAVQAVIVFGACLTVYLLYRSFKPQTKK